jgi:CHAD domain-containing protein
VTPDFPDKPLSARARRRLELATARGYELEDAESPGEGVRRAARGRVDSALEQLHQDHDGEPATAIHDTRKDMKKLRSLLRLVRDSLGEERYRAENRRFRDAARRLSSSRDAEVKLETLSDLLERYPDEAPRVTALRRALEEERERLAGDETTLAREMDAAADVIAAGGDEIADWRLGHDDFDLVRAGVERAYRRGRKALRQVRESPSEEAVHEWRKRVKDLWYQLRFLHNAWPGGLKAVADEAHELSDLLGDHHDVAVLVEDARGRAPDSPAIATLAELGERRQSELLAAALPLGERLYAEKPRQFARRLEAYWDAWRPPGAARS